MQGLAWERCSSLSRYVRFEAAVIRVSIEYTGTGVNAEPFAVDFSRLPSTLLGYTCWHSLYEAILISLWAVIYV